MCYRFAMRWSVCRGQPLAKLTSGTVVAVLLAGGACTPDVPSAASPESRRPNLSACRLMSGEVVVPERAALPLARYVNAVHARLHPVFADQFLASLDHVHQADPMNAPHLSTTALIVSDGPSGNVVHAGVFRFSGVAAFDAGVLDSVRRAAPFGAAPRDILSPDGNVYLRWEFYRDPFYACSTYFVCPYIVREASQSAN
jgi:hypothetical protein